MKNLQGSTDPSTWTRNPHTATHRLRKPSQATPLARLRLLHALTNRRCYKMFLCQAWPRTTLLRNHWSRLHSGSQPRTSFHPSRPWETLAVGYSLWKICLNCHPAFRAFPPLHDQIKIQAVGERADLWHQIARRTHQPMHLALR